MNENTITQGHTTIPLLKGAYCSACEKPIDGTLTDPATRSVECVRCGGRYCPSCAESSRCAGEPPERTIACPACEAEPGAPCRDEAHGELGHSHAARALRYARAVAAPRDDGRAQELLSLRDVFALHALGALRVTTANEAASAAYVAYAIADAMIAVRSQGPST